MLTIHEFAQVLTGLRRLVRLDARGLDDFDASLNGFWKSFWAAAFVLPVYLLVMVIDLGQNDKVDGGRYVAVQLISFVAEWAAQPLAMIYITRLLDREALFFRYAVALNWLRVVQAAAFLPLGLAGLLFHLPPDALAFFGLVVLTLMLMYEWFLARHALKLEGFAASGVVMIGFLISLFLDGIAARLIERGGV